MNILRKDWIKPPGETAFAFSQLLFFALLLVLTLPTFANDKYYPGKIVDIGTHRLYINCIGSGSPTVLIDSGIGGFSLEWHTVQNEIAKYNRVCAYDRAGYGFSETGPMPRTTDKISSELHTLIQKSGEQGPFLMVGHSFGGYNIRYFARQYPELVAGFVLVDASHPGQFDTLEFKRSSFKPKPITKNNIKIRKIRPVIAANFPQPVKQQAFMLMQSPKSKSTFLNEMDYMEVSAHKLNAQVHERFNFPITVITRGKRVWPKNQLGDQRESRWFQLQAELTSISTQARQVFAMNSGHVVHIDEPMLVASEIMTTLDAVQRHQYERSIIEEYGVEMVQNMTAMHPAMNLRLQDTSFNHQFQSAHEYLNGFMNANFNMQYSKIDNLHWVLNQ